MKSEGAIGKLSEETRQRLAACKTREEAEEVLADECGRPLDDELLDAIAGGFGGIISYHFPEQKEKYKPSTIC